MDKTDRHEFKADKQLYAGHQEGGRVSLELPPRHDLETLQHRQ